jgi:hypothetical protein
MISSCVCPMSLSHSSCTCTCDECKAHETKEVPCTNFTMLNVDSVAKWPTLVHVFLEKYGRITSLAILNY